MKLTRTHFFIAGTLGAMALLVVLIGLTYWSINGPYLAAQSLWDQKGSRSYTLVVEESCFCPNYGPVKITVNSGRVVAADPVPGAGSPGGPLPQGMQLSAFDSMTVESMLDTASRAQPNAWKSPWFESLSIGYDPTYGYVSSYSSDPNGRITELTGSFTYDASWGYTARDLVLLP